MHVNYSGDLELSQFSISPVLEINQFCSFQNKSIRWAHLTVQSFGFNSRYKKLLDQYVLILFFIGVINNTWNKKKKMSILLACDWFVIKNRNHFFNIGVSISIKKWNNKLIVRAILLKIKIKTLYHHLLHWIWIRVFTTSCTDLFSRCKKSMTPLNTQLLCCYVVHSISTKPSSSNLQIFINLMGSVWGCTFNQFSYLSHYKIAFLDILNNSK